MLLIIFTKLFLSSNLKYSFRMMLLSFIRLANGASQGLVLSFKSRFLLAQDQSAVVNLTNNEQEGFHQFAKTSAQFTARLSSQAVSQ
jgi:hypothetical protein